MEKPNILMIMVDQLTPFMTEVYGNDKVKTPNLDRLCKEGVKFDAAYTSCPLCAPARASMMTGKYVSDIDCYDNSSPFASDEPTFVHYLKMAGYETALSGKMHFIGPDQLHGFNTRLTTDIYPSSFTWYPRTKPSFAGEEGGDIGHKAHYPESWFAKPVNPKNKSPQYPGLASNYSGNFAFPTHANMYVNYDEEVFFRAKEYLHGNTIWNADTPTFEGKTRNYAIGREKAKEPFFLCISTHNPHDPFLPPKKYWEMYKDVDFDIPTREMIEACPQNIQDVWINAHHGNEALDLADPYNIQNVRRGYAALMTYLDDRIGEILENLEDDGILENTVILFTSDHGDMLMDRGMVQKRNLHEWSIRIPLIMRLPKKEYAGTVISDPCSIVDIGSTLRDISGTLNAGDLRIDGISLLEYLRNPDKTKNREIFVEFHSDGTFWPCYALVENDFKLIHIHEFGGQLFNLKADPKEMNDLYEDPAYSEVVKSMTEKILNRFDPGSVFEYYNKANEKRRIIDSGNSRFSEDWDYTPDFPGRDRYVRPF